MNAAFAVLFLVSFVILQARLYCELLRLAADREPWRRDISRRLVIADTCSTTTNCAFAEHNAQILDSYTVPDGVHIVLAIATQDGKDMDGDWLAGCSSSFANDLGHYWRVVIMHSEVDFVGKDSDMMQMIRRCISPNRIRFVHMRAELNDSTVGGFIQYALESEFRETDKNDGGKLSTMLFLRPSHCAIHTKHPHWLDLFTKRFLRTLPDPAPPFWVESATSRPSQMPISMQNVIPRNLPLHIMSCAWFRPSSLFQEMLAQTMQPDRRDSSVDFSLQFHLFRAANYTLVRYTAHHFASSNLICHAEAEQYLDRDMCVMFASWVHGSLHP